MNCTVVQVGTNSLSTMFPDVTIENYVDGDLPYGGGWNVALTNHLKQASDEFTYECWIMEKKAETPLAWERNGITFRLFPATRLRYIGEWSRALLRQATQESQKEILLTVHGLFNYTAFALPLVTSRTPIIIQHHGDLAAAQYARRAADRSKKIGYYMLDIARGEWFFERVSLPKVDHFFTLTSEVEEYLSQFVRAETMQRLSMGVDLNTFFKIDRAEAIKALGLDLNKRYVLYVGAMLPVKGIDYLIRALPLILKHFPNTILVLVGAGRLKTKLSELIKHLGIEDKVLLVPHNDADRYVGHDVLPLYYNAADVFVLPSLLEGLSVVLLEALACGTPIVTTTATHVIEQLGDGIIIPPKSTGAIADGVISVLGDKYPRMVDREKLRRSYDWKHIAEKHLEVYANLFAKYYE
ncbi:MAG: glycosyltransferase family 4 protein [Halobacteriota archaeon]